MLSAAMLMVPRESLSGTPLDYSSRGVLISNDDNNLTTHDFLTVSNIPEFSTSVASEGGCLSPLKLSHYCGSIGRVLNGSEAIFG